MTKQSEMRVRLCAIQDALAIQPYYEHKTKDAAKWHKRTYKAMHLRWGRIWNFCTFENTVYVTKVK